MNLSADSADNTGIPEEEAAKPLSPPLTFDHSRQRTIQLVQNYLFKHIYPARPEEENPNNLLDPGGVYAVTDVDTSGKKPYVNLGKDDENLSALRQANVLCFGGVYHDNQHIAKVPASLYTLLAGLNDPSLATAETVPFSKADTERLTAVVFNPISVPNARAGEAYQWNMTKNTVTTEAKGTDAVEGPLPQIWRAKFLDANGQLIPPDQFEGFCFFTYSMGARISLMVENGLRARLYDEISARREAEGVALNDSKQEEKEIERNIESYFDKIARVAVGSAVDLHQFKAQPRIQTIHIIGQSDRGVAYWRPFAERFIWDKSLNEGKGAPPGHFESGQHHAYIHLDNRQDYPEINGWGSKHSLILLDPTAVPTRRGDTVNANNHGLSEYVISLLQTVAQSQDRHLLLDALTIGCPHRQQEQPSSIVHGFSPDLSDEKRVMRL